MKYYLENGYLVQMSAAVAAVTPNAQEIPADALIYQLAGGIYGFSTDGVLPDGASDLSSKPVQTSIPNGNGGWVDAPEPEPTEHKVSTMRFKDKLLGGAVYGGLRVARIGLQAKFSAGAASETEVGYLTMLEAANGMIQGEPEIDLLNPAVAMVLDFAVANPYIAFDAEDKVRVLSDVAIAA